MLQPKKPVKLSNQTEGQHKAALKSYELALHKYNLENNPNQLKGESAKNYQQRSEYNEFRVKQVENKNPVKKWYNKMDASQEADPNYITRTTRKVLTSPAHVANYLDDVIDLKDTQKFKSTKTKLKEGTKAAGSLIDVIGLASLPGLETGMKNTVGIQQQIIEQGVKQLFSQNIQDNAEKGIENTIDYFFNPSEQKEPMKKSMNPRKKYMNGSNSGGVTPNGIPSPAATLNDYQIMMAKAEEEAANNEWLPVTALVGGLAQSAITFGAQGGFKKDANAVVAANGNNNVQGDVEVEGGEMFETPQGKTGEFQGPSHEQGGIPLQVGEDVEEGTIVYSDRLKVGKETLAERKASRERQITNLEKIASQPLVDSAIKNATKRKMEAIQKQEVADLQFQEQVNNMQQMADNVVAAFGTSMEGLQANPVGESMRYANGTGADGVTEYANGGIIPTYDEFGNLISPENTNLFTPQFTTPGVNPATAKTVKKTYATVGGKPQAPDYMKNLEQSPIPTFSNNFNTELPSAPSDYGAGAFLKTFDTTTLDAEDDAAFYKPGQVGTPKVTKEDLPGNMLSRGLGKAGTAIDKMGGVPGVGDIAGLFGDYLGATSGLKNAAEQRSTDVTHQNTMANAGKTSQAYLEKSIGNVEAMKRQAEMKATTSTRGAKVSARSGARGINQKRGVDWLYDQGLADSIASISANAAGQIAGIRDKQATVALSADQLIGEGQFKADEANEAAKDAYYTARGAGLKDQSLGIQNIGKDLNAMKQNKMVENLMKNYGTWASVDKKGNVVNKRTTPTTDTATQTGVLGKLGITLDPSGKYKLPNGKLVTKEELLTSHLT